MTQASVLGRTLLSDCATKVYVGFGVDRIYKV